MKGIVLGSLLLTLLVAAGCDGQRPDRKSALRVAGAHTFSSFDPPSPGEKLTPAHAIKFEQAELAQVLSAYAEISGRSIIRAANLPDTQITFSNQTPMTSVEVLQALDTVLAAHDVAMIILGTQYAKAVRAKEAHLEPGPVVELKPDQLPDSSSFLIYIVKMKNVKASQALPALMPLARTPNGIVSIGSGDATKGDILILRDYSSNVRRMLQVLEKMEER